MHHFYKSPCSTDYFLHRVADAMETVTRAGSQNNTESSFIYSK